MLGNTGIKLILVFLSLLISFLAVELSLRIFYPKYQYAAESNFELNTLRIYSRRANVRSERRHPDSAIAHPVIYNNLGLRQHRNFTENDLESAVNLGFFGDSFTENLRLPVPYSFTEVFDYLLNINNKRFNVLNFGVDGYGIDQSYLYYRDSEFSHHLDYVFYVLSANDLRNIYENNLFTVDDSGFVVQNTFPGTPWWIKVASKFYITYFVIDHIQRMFHSVNHLAYDKKLLYEEYQGWFVKERLHSQRADAIESDLARGQDNKDLRNSITIFEYLLEQWRKLVEGNGGKFFVVLLPRSTENLFATMISEDFNVINLYEEFNEVIEDYNYSDWRFRNDDHWNEAANLVASISLYRALELELGLPFMQEDALKRELYTYYSAFPNGWMPSEAWVTKTPIDPLDLSKIRMKYTPLEHIE